MGGKGKCSGMLVVVFELGADLVKFLGLQVESFAVLPFGVVRHKMDVGVGNVGADNLPESAGAELFFHVLAEFFDGGHEGLIVFIREVVDFVDLFFWYYESMTL